MLAKRKGCKLDEPSDEEMKSSCDKVEAMFPTSDKEIFTTPVSLEHTIYIDQGMRDQQAILLLKALETKKTGLVQ